MKGFAQILVLKQNHKLTHNNIGLLGWYDSGYERWPQSYSWVEKSRNGTSSDVWV